jgi:hypothetical protein
MDIVAIGWNCVDWTDLAQEKDRWRALVNAVMNLADWLVVTNSTQLDT